MDRLAGEIEPTLVAVLSDINMPEMDGLQLLGEIKQRFPDLPVMMVTAYGDDERRRLASEYGAAEFITKPVDFDFLTRCAIKVSGQFGRAVTSRRKSSAISRIAAGSPRFIWPTHRP